MQIGNKRRISDDDDNLTGSLSKRVRPHGELTAEFGEAEGDVDAEGESVSASTVSHRVQNPNRSRYRYLCGSFRTSAHCRPNAVDAVNSDVYPSFHKIRRDEMR